MEAFFNTEIKPLNDRLREQLNDRKSVKIKLVKTIAIVPVTISYTAHNGNRVTRRAGSKAFYEAMGIMI